MNYLSAEDLSISYGDKLLFEGLSFGLHKGEKTALIASNGTGKSTLLKILTGKESPDTGKVTLREGVRIAFLEQEPTLDENLTIDEMILSPASPVAKVIKEYEHALQLQSEEYNAVSQQLLEEATTAMDLNNAWDYERRLKQMLSLFKITDTNKIISTLSGGERKRLALATILLDEPDLLIMDEPTNHLDIDMIEWLENYLSKANLCLLMVTHDRYFLDRICDHIMEMSNGKIYYHGGNYEYFLEKKSEREDVLQIETDKARQLMKKELEWLRRMPKARTTKSKSRIQAFDGIKEKATGQKKEAGLNLQVKVARLGGKILEVESISKSYGNTTIVKNFSYLFKKGERIGIIGPNGSGKTSFLNLLTGIEKSDSGEIDTGQTIIFGYYRQDGLPLKEDKKVIEVVKDIAEVVRMGDGSAITASKFLEFFMFPAETQYKLVSKLSGGEKRRLNMLTVLIKNPNFLILDEPTNDLDLLALNRLEEFLLNYKGCLILVSHDRYFLDKLTDHLFVFEGEGRIKDFYGTYTRYRAEKLQDDLKADAQAEKKTLKPKENLVKAKVKIKLSFNEQREYNKLEKEIEELENEKLKLENILSSGSTAYEELTTVTSRLGEVIRIIDEKSMRWMELDDLV